MSFGIHHGMDVEKATRNRCNKAVASYFIFKAIPMRWFICQAVLCNVICSMGDEIALWLFYFAREPEPECCTLASV